MNTIFDTSSSARVQEYFESLCQALQRWRLAIGEQFVITDSDSVEPYGRDSGLKTTTVRVILMPGNTEELQSVVRIASEHRIPIYTISKGKNWAYGAACPVISDSVVLDLGRLNRILEVNQELAYAVIEPGVTQEQLYNYLEDNGIPLCMDVTGSTPDSSLIGNIAERGYGQTPYGDRFQHTSSMEVLLSDGTFFQTSFGHYERSKSHYLYKWGIGPYLDGLFTQSNFGIVTKIGIWLMPKPKEVGLVAIKVDSDEKASDLMTKLRDLKLRGLLPSTVHVSNELRVIGCFQQFPFATADSSAPIDEETKQTLMKKWGVGSWNCFTSLRGSKREIRTALKEIRSYIGDTAKVEYISSTTASIAKSSPRLSKILTGRDAKQTFLLYSLVSGKPSRGPVFGMYWKKPNPPSVSPLDPLKDNCGLVWCAPVMPNTKKEISTFLELTRGLLSHFAFETNLTLTLISERAVCCTVGLFFDKENLDDMKRAKECYDTCLKQFMANGYIPYRHGINVEECSEALFKEDDPYWKTCRTLKNALDPTHILSPGKYNLW